MNHSIPVVAAVALVASAFSGGEAVEEDEDGALWQAIVANGDVLLGSSFREAVVCHPLRVESLVTQRIFRPFLLLAMRLVRPWTSVQALDDELRSAWMRRNESLRSSSGISASSLGDALASSWKQNSRLIVETLSMPTQETGQVVSVMASRRPDIRRAFTECRTLLEDAACVDGSDALGWFKICSVVDDMEAVLTRLVEGQGLEGDADISSDVGLALPASSDPDPTDRFGAVSMSSPSDLTDVSLFGYHGAHEEYLVSGHRAPAVGLDQYRRMGGRVF